MNTFRVFKSSDSVKQDNIFYFGEDHLTASKALSLARKEITGKIRENTWGRIRESHSVVQQIVDTGEPVYGINTGFGPLCTTSISREETSILQRNILQSHSVGVGEPVDPEIAALMLVLKIHSLARGFSGISEPTLKRLLWHLENEAIPLVPSKGSVGASGDLAPLSHLFLPLLGLGKVHFRGEVITGKKLMEKTALKPVELGPKEGLALINGTQFIAAHTVKVLEGFHNCLSHADIIGAMMIEGLQGSLKPFYKQLHELRPFKGTQHVARRIKSLLEGSEIMEDHIDCERVQDPYSLRCIPQVHGASRNAWLHLKELLEVELNSVTDNPIIVDKDLTISGGNFHGQPLAMALDYACLAASELGNISDRRIYLALEGNSPGIPKLLMKETGINSGYMILQYTSAALASENKTLCYPASADSIPTSLGQEDHVSMGSIAGRKALQVIENVEKILAIELLTAAQAFEFRKPLRSGAILEMVHKEVRKKVSFASGDRVFADDIEEGIKMIHERSVIAAVNAISNKKGYSLKTPFSKEFEAY